MAGRSGQRGEEPPTALRAPAEEERPGGRPAAAGTGGRLPVSSPAQARLLDHIAAGRGARRRRAFLIICGTLSALVMLLAAAAWGVTSYVNGAVGRVGAGTAGGGYSGPINVLLAGVDVRAGLTREQERKLHVGRDVSANSDTMMLVHISGDRSRVTVISLPRDSWVDIPGHGMNKINAAFGLGGPRLMVATVEHATGLTINHYIEVGFLGFVKVIDALGGVNVCLRQPVNDPYSGLRLSAGMHHVNGITALKYARDRHSFAASDLARISDQQSLLSSLLSEALSAHTLTDPVRVAVLVRSALGAVRVDQGLDLAALADQLRGLSLHHVQFLTVPLASANYLTPNGQSAVLWNAAAAQRIFASLRADQPLPGRAAGHARGHGTRHRGRPHAAHAAHGGGGGPAGARTAAQDACK